MNVAPEPCTLSTIRSPPKSRMMEREMLSPRPVPSPERLVVKNGSKMWDSAPDAMHFAFDVVDGVSGVDQDIDQDLRQAPVRHHHPRQGARVVALDVRHHA